MTAEELRICIRRHLAERPGTALTALQVARTLGFGANGVYRIRYQLRKLAEGGEVEQVTGRRTASDHRPAVRWRAS